MTWLCYSKKLNARLIVKFAGCLEAEAIQVTAKIGVMVYKIGKDRLKKIMKHAISKCHTASCITYEASQYFK